MLFGRASGMLTMASKLGARMAVAVLLACGFLATSPAGANAETVFLKVGNAAGGGFDLAGRLVARHLGRFLDGTPDIVVQNVPGAGGLRLALMLEDTEPSDGSVVGLFTPSLLTQPLLEPESSDFNVRNLRMVGSLTNQPSICYSGLDSGIETLQDFTGKEFLIGATGQGSATFMLPAAIKNLLGTKFKIVTGFQGINPIDAAIATGEIQAQCGNSLASMRTTGVIDSVRILMQISIDVKDETRSIPSLLDLIEDEQDREATRLLITDRKFIHLFSLPTGTNDEILKRYRVAFGRMVTDAEFLAEAKKLGFDISPSTGEEIENTVAEIYAADDAVVQRARELIKYSN